MRCSEKKSYPTYTARYDRKSVWRGDTVKALSLRLSEEDGSPLVPISVCAQLRRSRDDDLIYEFAYTIDPGTGWVVIQPVAGSITSQWPVGMHDYDVQFTLPGGVVRTLLAGNFSVFEDVSRC